MFDGIILMAGRGRRSGLDYNKVLFKHNNKEIFKYSLETFLKSKYCNKVILVINEADEAYIEKSLINFDLSKVIITYGASTRQASVYNGLKQAKSKYVLVHDAARALIDLETINDVYKNVLIYDSVVVALKSIDTIKKLENGKLKTLDRDKLYNIQTPQALNLEKFTLAHQYALRDEFLATDDVSLLEKYFNLSAHIVEGSRRNFKITAKEDLEYFKFLLRSEQMDFRIGHSHDTHKLEKGRKLILGGIEIDYEYGLVGHSDADCVLHVVSEAIIGALGLGDIGKHFPDNDPKNKDMESSFFVTEIVRKMDELNYEINNLDLIIFLEEPFLKPYISLMKENIAKLLKTDPSFVNIKATRREGLGYIGRKEGISSECIVMLRKSL